MISISQYSHQKTNIDYWLARHSGKVLCLYLVTDTPVTRWALTGRIQASAKPTWTTKWTALTWNKTEISFLFFEALSTNSADCLCRDLADARTRRRVHAVASAETMWSVFARVETNATRFVCTFFFFFYEKETRLQRRRYFCSAVELIIESSYAAGRQRDGWTERKRERERGCNTLAEITSNHSSIDLSSDWLWGVGGGGWCCVSDCFLVSRVLNATLICMKAM